MRKAAIIRDHCNNQKTTEIITGHSNKQEATAVMGGAVAIIRGYCNNKEGSAIFQAIGIIRANALIRRLL